LTASQALYQLSYATGMRDHDTSRPNGALSASRPTWQSGSSEERGVTA
jgi:hypothetical protein